jgi:hypothetical protein
VKHLITFKRQFGFLLLGLTLALSVIIPLAVGATNPAPATLDCNPQCLRLDLPTATPDLHAPEIEGVYTRRYYPEPAVSPVRVEVDVTRTSSVDLIMPGIITLVSHTDTEYLFEVTGLVPYGNYSYKVVAHGVFPYGATTDTRVGTVIG